MQELIVKKWGWVELNDLSIIATEVKDYLSTGGILLLNGEMGAGKTTFVKELLLSFGSTDKVTSPTFSIINEYQTGVKLEVAHMDLYRLKSAEEAIDAGIVEYLDRANWLIIIEWADIIRELLLGNFYVLNIEVINPSARKFSLIYSKAG
jgi:tRNA threonylcarbamoyladenosine biosynthesis protein TsaE